MSRRIILVDFYWTRDKDPRVPLGHASLLATLRQQIDLEVSSVVIPVNGCSSDAADVVSRLLAEAKGLAPSQVDVAFGAYVWGETLLQQVLKQLRANGFGGRIILGGPQISYSGPGLERIYPDADAFIRGYGEQALLRLVRSSQRQLIRGVHWKGIPDAVEQADVALEDLPSPWLSGVIPLDEQPFIRWETQRGCQFRCAFCQHKEQGSRLTRRELDLSRVQAEIDLFCASGVRDIAVLDPIFNTGNHAVAVLKRFAQHRFTGRLSLQCRAELVDQAFLDAASDLDVRLEFGLQTVNSDEAIAIKRRNQIERVDQVLADVRSRGISHEVSLIFGLPRQTLSSFEASIAWCLDRAVPVIKAFPLMLLRGTELERDRNRWRLVDSGGDMPFVIGSESFDFHQWRSMAKLSEALRITEGYHPETLTELQALAETLEPDIFRWVPKSLRDVA